MQNIHTSRERCTHCGKLLIPALGNPKSPLLLVGDFPNYLETKQGFPFAFRNPHNAWDNMQSGDILREELTRVGIMMNSVLLTNLWMHGKDWKMETTYTKTGKEKQQKVPACPPEFHLDSLVKMFAGKTHVLLMGSEVTQALIGKTVQQVSGTQVVVPGIDKKIHFWVSPNPALAFNQPLGELRLAFQRFSDDVSGKTKKKTK
jgi:uracil-DNA glycosylase